MPTGTFANFGYSTSDGSEESFADFASLFDVTSSYTVDFPNDDGTLNVGDDFSISFFGSVNIFFFPLPFSATISATYTGTDPNGSVHFDVNDLSLFPNLFPAPDLSGINEATTFRVTNAEPFPADKFPATVENPLPVCFAAGTPIATPAGERAVETLRPGERVLSADGRALAVRWIGRQTLHRIVTPPERFRPVRIRAGALGPAVPHRDLVVTPDHGLLVGGLLVNAGALVNGTTIERVPMDELAETVTYWHVETDAHEVILAAGAPAESYVDGIAGRAFQNHAERAAPPGPAAGAELPYPRCTSRRQLPPRIAERIAARAVGREREAA